MAEDTVPVRIETDESSDEIEVPLAVAELLSEDDDDDVTTIVGDLAMLGLAQQAHGIVHHTEGEIGEELAAAEQLTMELFEQRFGQSYADVTGHNH